MRDAALRPIIRASAGAQHRCTLKDAMGMQTMPHTVASHLLCIALMKRLHTIKAPIGRLYEESGKA
jgi:hypothetical protein